MTRAMAALFAFAAVTSLVVAAENYSSKDGKYSATFPAKPKEVAQEVDSPVGKIKMFISAAEAKKDLAFMVIYNDYPAVVTQAPAQKVLEGVRDGSKGPTGKVVSDKELMFGDAKTPGRDYVLDKGGNFFRSRSILAKERLYQVVVVGKTEKDVTSPEADDFIKSFKIGE